MNHIVIMGRLTRDPELRHTPNGVAVASFSLAVDRGFTPKDGGEKQTDFIDVVAWRNTAEFVSKYFVKGQMAAVVGRLQIRDWQDKDGNKRRSAEVVADNIYFTESKKSREASFGPVEVKDDINSNYTTPVEGSDFSELDIDDGELPF
ncbi:MAG: single-stranded DNA-binding protein [Oscillospiraceae bacterium]|nr:single-stranded DNA-binding protein [Oscillospiraceae bacterium]